MLSSEQILEKAASDGSIDVYAEAETPGNPHRVLIN